MIYIDNHKEVKAFIANYKIEDAIEMLLTQNDKVTCEVHDGKVVISKKEHAYD